MKRSQGSRLPSSRSEAEIPIYRDAFRRSLFLLTSHVSLLTAFLLLCTPWAVHAQWEPDVRLTYEDHESRTSFNNSRCVAVDIWGGVHIVWWDNRDSNLEVYYKRSTDYGVTWTPDMRLTYAINYSEHPSIAIVDSTLHVTWGLDNRDGHPEIYYKQSPDLGTTWSQDRRLTLKQGVADYPAIAVAGSNVHIVWEDERDDGYGDIYYKRSTDSGVTWTQDIRLVIARFYTRLPSIAAEGCTLHLTWMDFRDGITYEIYYKRSSDSGMTWSTDTLLSSSPDSSTNPSISTSGNLVCIVWSDLRDGNKEIYFRRSSNAGLNWSPEVRLTYEPDSSVHPSVWASKNLVHVVWEDYRIDGYSPEIYYKRSTDGGLIWDTTDTRLTNADWESQFPSVAVLGFMVHIVWMDYRDGNFEIFYKRNPTGNTGTEETKRHGEEAKRRQNFRALPNPIKSFATIPGHEAEKFALYDISGRKVGTYRGDRIGEGLSAGVYFIKPENGGAKPLRIVKLR